MNKQEALKLIAGYGRAVSQTCHIYSGRSRRDPYKAIKEETKHVRKLLKAMGITEEATEEEIDNA